jgi:hypothetical protein
MAAKIWGFTVIHTITSKLLTSFWPKFWEGEGHEASDGKNKKGKFSFSLL